MAVRGNRNQFDYDHFFKLIVIRADLGGDNQSKRNKFLEAFFSDSTGVKGGKTNKPRPSPAAHGKHLNHKVLIGH